MKEIRDFGFWFVEDATPYKPGMEEDTLSHYRCRKVF